MSQMLLGRYVCQRCRNFARVGMLDTRTNQYFLSAVLFPGLFRQGEWQSQQVRWHAYRRPNEQPGLIGRFIENLKEGFERNKEMQENIKKFQEEAKKYEQSESLSGRVKFANKIKEGVSSASMKTSAAVKSFSGAFSSKVSKAYEEAATSEAFKKGRAVSEELTKSAKDAASKVQEQTEVLGKTETFKAMSAGLKTFKVEVLDEELEKSRPYKTPEKLRRRTGAEGEFVKKERRIDANEDATGMVLHKDSKWYQQWQEFKDNNPVLTGLFSLKTKYDESDNVVIRASRVVTDKLQDIFSDVFSQSDTAKTMAEISRIDPQFNKDSFLKECEFEIIPAVLEAFLRGDLEILKDWCYEPAFNVLAAQIEQTRQLGQRLEAKILDVRDVDVAMAKVMEQGPVLVLTFMVQQIMILRDAVGNVIEGGEDNIENVSYVWALCRDQSILDHRSAWRVLEFGIQSSSSWL
ncbi:mitochondrial import inner membrane translocase subunit TIM44-like [Acropora millepora]|uniref:mitochondrial import inner membrane translocase subunit TIM44-like n=1 Tax=Acropora millepora TaxID=45264 RepID=UPI001CF46D3A|nr:mitochondrial import inner membrane translocase subunit TIM44-like [Acropora millepora]